ncbi:MAG: MFS transporter [Pseudomonadota bacterium]
MSDAVAPLERQVKFSIATLCAAVFAVGIDFSGALLLITSIQKDFEAQISTVQWVLNLYALVYATVMVIGGRLGDMFGRRPVLFVGAVIFSIASAVCFLAPSIEVLIAARALQGVGAGLIFPSALGMGSVMAGERRRGFVIGLILGSITAGNIAGPLLSGLVTSIGDWRLFFVVNTILGVAMIVLVLALLAKDTKSNVEEGIDYAGILILGGAVLTALGALNLGPQWGWTSPGIIGLFVIALVLLISFPVVEGKVRDPIMPVSLMRNPQFMLALSANGLLVPCLFILFLYTPQYMEKVMGWAVWQASLGMTPLMVLLAVGSVVAGRLYGPVGPRKLILAGYGATVLCALWMITAPPAWAYLAVFPGLLLIGVGATLVVGTSGTAVVSAVPPERAGVASGLSFMVHLVFGALGVATATAIFHEVATSKFRGVLHEYTTKISAADMEKLITQAPGSTVVQGILGSLEPASADRVKAAMADAFVHGFGYAFVPGLVPALMGVLVALLLNERALKASAHP